ncbi:unnamed protein product [Macrosiphum euphorbiae]|nr:unnamed protein product [Macrosiphum euphorbiae]
MQEEEGGENCGTDEEGQDNVDSVCQSSFVTDEDGYGERNVECGQSGSRYSDIDGFQTEGGSPISHFRLDNFDRSMAPGTFCNIDEPKEMDDYEPGKRRATGGMQYGGYSYEGENQGHVARSSPIYEHMLRRIVDRICDIDFRGNDRYISDVIVPCGPNGVDEVTKELQNMLRQFPPKLPVIVTVHGDLVHSVHVCRQSNSACQCIWLQRSVLYRQHGRRRLRRSVWAIFFSFGAGNPNKLTASVPMEDYVMDATLYKYVVKSYLQYVRNSYLKEVFMSTIVKKYGSSYRFNATH